MAIKLRNVSYQIIEILARSKYSNIGVICYNTLQYIEANITNIGQDLDDTINISPILFTTKIEQDFLVCSLLSRIGCFVVRDLRFFYLEAWTYSGGAGEDRAPHSKSLKLVRYNLKY